jgi:hypothetical protein
MQHSVINYSRMVVSGVLTKWISSGHCKLKYVQMSLPWWWLSPVTGVNSQSRKQRVAVFLPSLQCMLHSGGETEWKWVWGEQAPGTRPVMTARLQTATREGKWREAGRVRTKLRYTFRGYTFPSITQHGRSVWAVLKRPEFPCTELEGTDLVSIKVMAELAQ